MRCVELSGREEYKQMSINVDSIRFTIDYSC